MMTGSKTDLSKTDLSTVKPLLKDEDTKYTVNIIGKESVKENNGSCSNYWPQIVTTLLVDVGALIAGAAGALNGIFLPEIRNDLNADIQQGSWIVSIPIIGMLIGCLLAAWTTEKFGRLRTLQLCCIPAIVGWAGQGFSHSLTVYFIASFFVGLANGINAGSKVVYISEIADAKLRGLLSSSTTTAIHFGMLVVFVLALGCSWRTVSFMVAGSALFELISFFFIVESPTWLVKNNQPEKAKEALKKLRGANYDVNSELEEITKKHLQNISESEEVKGNWKQSFSLYFSRQTMKAFGILFVLFFTSRFSGLPAIMSYSRDIFDAASNGKIDSHWAIIISGAVRLVMTFVGNYIIKKFSKKIIYGISGAGMAISLLIFATYDYLLTHSDSDIGYAWIPAASICLFIGFVTPGFIAITWVLIGELFPQKTRGTMSSILSCIAYILFFVSVKAYPDMVTSMQVFGVFFFNAAVTIIGTVVIVIILPETSGKTLTEIEDDMSKVKTINKV